MRCAWETLLGVLPVWLRSNLDKQAFRELLEIRLRLNRPLEFVYCSGSVLKERIITADDLEFCVHVASQYSPWASPSLRDGFITIEGGHRIGICGSCAMEGNEIRCIRQHTSVCIRIAREFPGISKDLCFFEGSLLIIGRPGCGKTTLLRDLIQRMSLNRSGGICVIDEKREIFPMLHDQMCFQPGPRTDVIAGCGKRKGIEIGIRNMSPQTVVVDEITAADDCSGLLEAGWCGVQIIASAHAADMRDLRSRPVYGPLLEKKLFDGVVVMNSDKSWYFERMK